MVERNAVRIPPPSEDLAVRDWQALVYFGVYRAALSSLLAGIALVDTVPRTLGAEHPTFYTFVSLAYVAMSLVSLTATKLRRPGFSIQLPAQIFGDIAALTILMHANGGVTSGFGMLLVVAIAGGSILSGGRMAILFAAFATLCVLGEQVYAAGASPWTPANYPHAGMLGAAFFATAILANYSAQRLRASEALAARREVDLADLGRLNEHIVQRMQSGIMVVGADGRIRLCNESAARLLGFNSFPASVVLAEALPTLAEVMRRWEANPVQASFLMQSPASHLAIQVSFAALAGGRDGALLFLEDHAAISQRVQQLKLASLGRLAGSIAHEIRNPLSAIAHANGLLRESASIPENDRRLMDIVDSNARRMNEIVESVLRLSRRSPSDPQSVQVRQWLNDFKQELQTSAQLEDGQVPITVEPEDLRVRVDTGQMRQVLWNLCENALQHAVDERPVIRLEAGLAADSRRPYLDILDNGPGIPEESLEQLFEPFFTTRVSGSGLGLYIARELCEANQASLNHRRTKNGCCFRITFADPRRLGAIPA